MKRIQISILYILLTSCVSCGHPDSPGSLQEGDLLFQNLDCGPLCDAIEAVTEGVDGKDFSHIGLLVRDGDSLEVLEAIGEKVQLTPLHKFYARSGDTAEVRNITAGRLKPEYQNLIPGAVQYAKSQIGQPYDEVFLENNGKWYCSELIYAAFRNANRGKDLFVLSSMTFKDPATQQFFPAWVDYYGSLHTEIPEDKPGINPGGISRSEKIMIMNINTPE